ncbi:MAG: hypothetical protein ACXVGF_04885 [Blastococcus sp.]
MALVTVVAIAGNAAVLSLNVDTSNVVVGWQCQNNTGGPCQVRLSSGAFSVRQSAPVGLTTGNVPKARQWNYVTGADMTYELGA